MEPSRLELGRGPVCRGQGQVVLVHGLNHGLCVGLGGQGELSLAVEIVAIVPKGGAQSGVGQTSVGFGGLKKKAFKGRKSVEIEKNSLPLVKQDPLRLCRLRKIWRRCQTWSP